MVNQFKRKLFIAVFLTAALPWASAGAEVQDPPPIVDDIGKITIHYEVTHIDDIYEPLRMSVSVICNDRRAKKTKAKPKLTYIIADSPICDYRPYAWNPESKILTLKFSTHIPGPGQATCNSHFEQEFELATFCQAWQN